MATATKKRKKVGLVPRGDRILIERDDAEKESPGGIVLPDKSQEKPRTGTILAVGPGPRLQDGTRGDMELTVGQRVLFAPFAEELEVDDRAVVLAREDDVLGVLPDEE